MKLFLNNMVSPRCKMIVEAELENMGLHYVFVQMGEMETKERLLSLAEKNQLNEALLKSGLELTDNRKAILIEKIKTVIVEMIHYSDEPIRINFSGYLSKKLNHSYNYLSSVFSGTKGTTIEHYIIAHKIERVKELLVYNELTLKEIAWKLHYSSAAHLSSQFKKVTSLTPSFFKKMEHKRLIAIENL